eukprot:6211514-Pleurochrysis_carterae.AAC.3
MKWCRPRLFGNMNTNAAISIAHAPASSQTNACNERVRSAALLWTARTECTYVVSTWVAASVTSMHPRPWWKNMPRGCVSWRCALAGYLSTARRCTKNPNVSTSVATHHSVCTIE